MLGRHETSYGFDLCNKQHCQAYIGCARINENVEKAVEETVGIVLAYNGNIAQTYYSSSVGGVTVSAKEAWGGEYPYLKAVHTPWERYREHANGSWTVELSPAELANELRNAGYSQIKGNIQSVKINQLAENSSYVYSITFTDTYGNSLTLERSDNIRYKLTSFLKSANFVVGKVGDTLQVIDYVFVDDLDQSGQLIETKTEDKNEASENSSISENGFQSSQNPNVITANGITRVDSDTYFAVNSMGMTYIDNSRPVATLTSQGDGAVVLVSNFDLDYDYEDNWGNTSTIIPENAIMGETTTIVKNITVEGSPGNFVFIGRGYGHGVGLSQWGAYDMAELGFKWQDILSAYFPGTEYVDYQSILN